MTKILSGTEPHISTDFQKRFIFLIEEHELKKKDLPKLIGISRDVINRALIYAIVPSLQSLIKIADYFSVPILYLVAETDDDYFDKAKVPISFHERLDALVKEKNTKYSIIAHSMTFPENYFYDWKRTKTLPSLEYLKEIAQYFKVSPDYLLGRTDDRN